MTQTRVALVPMATLALFAAACGGGGTKSTATSVVPGATTSIAAVATGGDSDSAYFAELDRIFAQSQRSFDDAAATRTVAPNFTPIPESNSAGVAAGVENLQAVGSGLEALTPTDATRDAHQRLLDAVRELIVVGQEQRDAATPDNDATAEAKVGPAIERFFEACTELATAGRNADSPVNLGCGE